MMTSKTINFTKLAVQNLTAEKGAKRTSFKDSQINGLVIDVRATGSKSFYVYKKIRGVPEKIFLGKFPDLSVENARKLALIKLGEIAVGKNPLDQVRKERSENTFEEIFQEYMSRYSKKHKKSWKYDEREVTKFLSHWFKRKIGDINKTDVQRLVEKVHDENGLYQASRLLVAHVAALLMSEEGSFITGSDLLMDGGVTASYWYGELGKSQNNFAPKRST